MSEPHAPAPAGGRRSGEASRLESLFNDIRHARRVLRKDLRLTLAAVLTAALGIGASTAVFSVFYAVLIQPLPYPDSGRLVQLWETNEEVAKKRGQTVSNLRVSIHNYWDYREKNTVLSEMGYLNGGIIARNLGSGPHPLRAKVQCASGSLFETLGIRPLHGRFFTEDEDDFGPNRKVAILNYGLWKNHFGGDPAMVGREILLDEQPHRVVGVMPEGFDIPPRHHRGPDLTFAETDLFIPLYYDLAEAWGRDARPLDVIARLKRGVTLEQARAELRTIAQELSKAYPDSNRNWTLQVTPVHELLDQSYGLPLLIFMAAVLSLLVIACVNVAGLLMAKAADRRTEMAIRSALGGTRWRLLTQLLAESLGLALLSGAAGLVLAVVGIRLLVPTIPQAIARVDQVAVNPPVFLFALAVSLLSALLFGLFPAWKASKTEVGETLKSGAMRISGSSTPARVLLGFQVALAVVLLVGASVLTLSFFSVASRDLGFDPENLLVVGVNLGYPGGERMNNLNEQVGFFTHEERASLYRSILEGIRALPQVEDAALASGSVPLHRTDWIHQWKRTDEGWVGPWSSKKEALDTVRWLGNSVGPAYFRVLGVPLLKGRTFADLSEQSGNPTMILSRSLAEHLWPGEDPLGKTIRSIRGNLQVVGVVEELAATIEDVTSVTDRRFSFQVYYSATQAAGRDTFFIVRTRVGTEPLSVLPMLEDQISRFHPNLPVTEATTMESVVARSVARPRFYMLLMVVFAGAALALSIVGIYALVSRSVRNRWREIGIRMALGARQSRILALVVKETMAPTAAGALAGMLSALLLLEPLKRLLYGMEPDSVALFLTVGSAMLAAAFCSSLVPAFRAMHVDPATALRQD